MGTLKQKLDYIKETKQLIGNAITAKGGTVTNNFREYATAITNLPSGEGGGGSAGPASVDFGVIGYSAEDVAKMKSDIAYSKKRQADYDPNAQYPGYKLYSGDRKLVYGPQIELVNAVYLEDMFVNCSNLVCVPLYDTKNITNMSGMFCRCPALTTIPKFNTSSVKYMQDMFSHDHSLTSIPQLDTKNVENMNRMFDDCYNLKEIPALNTQKVTNFSEFAGTGMPALLKINELSFKSATKMEYTFNSYTSSSICYMLLKDLGTPESVTFYDFSKCDHWGFNREGYENYGVDLTGAGQTVVDSLLTYSFDRKTAGYATCTFKCHANMKKYLTEEQITAIQNKGYTITF